MLPGLDLFYCTDPARHIITADQGPHDLLDLSVDDISVCRSSVRPTRELLDATNSGGMKAGAASICLPKSQPLGPHNPPTVPTAPSDLPTYLLYLPTYLLYLPTVPTVPTYLVYTTWFS